MIRHRSACNWVARGFSRGGLESPIEFVFPTAEAVGHPVAEAVFHPEAEAGFQPAYGDRERA